MKTRKLRLVSALLALAMLLAMVPVGAWAEGEGSASSSSKTIKIEDIIDFTGTPETNPNYGYPIGSSGGATSVNSVEDIGTAIDSSKGWNFYTYLSDPKYPSTRNSNLYLLNGFTLDCSHHPDYIFEAEKTGNFNNYGVIKNGIYNCEVSNSSSGIIENGTFYCSIYGSSNSIIKNGTFGAGTRSMDITGGDITGGTFTNHCYISARTHMHIAGGTFAGGVHCDSMYRDSAELSIYSGIFNAKVGNSAGGIHIYGGTFNNSVEIGYKSSISANTDSSYTPEPLKFSSDCTLTITNQTGKIETGTYDIPVTNESGTISGGVFHKTVTNKKNITGGIFDCDVTNDGNSTRITGGIFKNKPEAANSPASYLLKANTDNIKIEDVFSKEAYLVGAQTVTVTSAEDMSNWVADNTAATLSEQSAHSLKVTVPDATESGTIVLGPAAPAKKTPSADDFELDADAKKVIGKNGINDNDIESVVVKDAAGNTKTVTGNVLSKLEPGTYTVESVATKENDNYTAGTTDVGGNGWTFTINDTTMGGDDNNNNTTTKKYPISGSDSAEVTVTDQNDNKRENNEAEKGDTVRVTLPEDKRNPGGMVFDGWILDVEPEEKTADVLEALKQNGYKPGEPDTSFTVPDLPDGTKLNFRPHYVTPDQSGSSDDSFLMTAAAVAGGAALTGFVAWQGYNIFAEVYMKQALPAGAVLPQNRQELALLLWNKAGTPAPADSTLYTDMDADDTNAQAAARWAVESELLKPADKNDSNVFKPEKSVSVGQVYRAWKKAEALS